MSRITEDMLLGDLRIEHCGCGDVLTARAGNEGEVVRIHGGTARHLAWRARMEAADRDPGPDVEVTSGWSESELRAAWGDR